MKQIFVWQTRHARRSRVASGTCDLGNGAVRSSRDNVPTAAVPAGWGPAKHPMGNLRKPLINPVTHKWRKALGRHAKRQVARGRCSCIAAPPLVARPGKRGSLKEALNVDLTTPGKPVGPHQGYGGIPRVIEGEGPAGRGWQKKRMPGCNGPDRAGARAPEIPNPEGCRLLPGPN